MTEPAGFYVRRDLPPPASSAAGKAFLWMDGLVDETRTGPLWLRQASIAAMVVVMPDHVHLLTTPRAEVRELMR